MLFERDIWNACAATGWERVNVFTPPGEAGLTDIDQLVVFVSACVEAESALLRT